MYWAHNNQFKVHKYQTLCYIHKIFADTCEQYKLFSLMSSGKYYVVHSSKGVEVFFTRTGDFTWRVSDCEELVGGDSQEMMRFP